MLQDYDQALLKGAAPAEMTPAEAEAEAGHNEALLVALASHVVSLLPSSVICEGSQPEVQAADSFDDESKRSYQDCYNYCQRRSVIKHTSLHAHDHYALATC